MSAPVNGSGKRLAHRMPPLPFSPVLLRGAASREETSLQGTVRPILLSQAQAKMELEKASFDGNGDVDGSGNRGAVGALPRKRKRQEVPEEASDEATKSEPAPPQPGAASPTSSSVRSDPTRAKDETAAPECASNSPPRPDTKGVWSTP